jgi:nucleotide-binding universal stress UspA family protein
MLAVHTILYPTDLSERSNAAFPIACSLARDQGARLIVLHVVLPPLGQEELLQQREASYFDGVWQELRRLQAPDANVNVEHRMEIGESASSILRVAEETKTGLIVLTTHGRTGLSRLLVGSVAEQVLRKATCPVMTVKTPALEQATKTEKSAAARLA